jgi:hypothetical protein
MLFTQTLNLMNTLVWTRGFYFICLLVLFSIFTVPGIAGVHDEISVPTSDDIVLINNSPQGLHLLDLEYHVPVDRERIRAFFSGGCRIYTVDPILGYFVDAKGQPVKFMNSKGQVVLRSIVNAGPLTLPTNLPEAILSEARKREAQPPKENEGVMVNVEGALMTKQHRIYFWRLYSDTVLLLWDESGNKRALVQATQSSRA